MILHVTKARFLSGYKIWLSFNDGSSGEVDLAGKLTGSMFEPLLDKQLFARFRVDKELGTIVWDNGADLAPEYLKQLLPPEPATGATNRPSLTGKGNAHRPQRPFRGSKKLAGARNGSKPV
jgi:hypothetical protein